MEREDMRSLEDAFVAGYRDAPDKRAFLDLTGIPLTLERPAPGLRLLEVSIEDRYRVGSAAPGFGTRELSYQPLAGAMVTRSTKLRFVYVSADEVVELSLADLRDAGSTGGEDRSPALESAREAAV